MKTVIWKQVIQTDENDKAVLQIFESGTAFHLIQIDHTLIVSGAQGQILDAACLHLDIVDSPAVILHVHIETHAASVVSDLDGNLLSDGNDPAYLSADRKLRQHTALFRIVCHNLAEHEIIRYGQLLIFLSHNISLLSYDGICRDTDING